MNTRSTARLRTISVVGALCAVALVAGCALPDNYDGGGFVYIDSGYYYHDGYSIWYYDPYYHGYSPYFGSPYFALHGFPRGHQNHGFTGHSGGGKHGDRDHADQDQDHAGDGDGDKAGKHGRAETKPGKSRRFARRHRGGEANAFSRSTTRVVPSPNKNSQATPSGSGIRSGITPRRSGDGARTAASTVNRSPPSSSSSASPSSTKSFSASSPSRPQGAKTNSRPPRASRFQPRRDGGNRHRQGHPR